MVWENQHYYYIWIREWLNKHRASNNYIELQYSVVSIKRTGGNKGTGGGTEFYHLLHEKQVQGGAKTSK